MGIVIVIIALVLLAEVCLFQAHSLSVRASRRMLAMRGKHPVRIDDLDSWAGRC
jgi:hypothetical protein